MGLFLKSFLLIDIGYLWLYEDFLMIHVAFMDFEQFHTRLMITHFSSNLDPSMLWFINEGWESSMCLCNLLLYYYVIQYD